jgi:hypothetical protein
MLSAKAQVELFALLNFLYGKSPVESSVRGLPFWHAFRGFPLFLQANSGLVPLLDNDLLLLYPFPFPLFSGYVQRSSKFHRAVYRLRSFLIQTAARLAALRGLSYWTSLLLTMKQWLILVKYADCSFGIRYKVFLTSLLILPLYPAALFH